jgi:cytochrome c-type biogenesis protein CcmF
MMTELGHYALALGLCLALYALLAGLWSLRRNALPIAESGKNALMGISACTALASVALWGAIFSHDFSVRYAFRHSAVDMPAVYLFTSFWSALEGSHLLWTLILSLVTTVALATLRRDNRVYLPGLVVAFSVPQIFMLLLNVWESAPLARQFPAGQYGSGMNALLQNPYMAIHPPTLFLGYCGLVVPFAFGAAALLRGRLTTDWLITVRRWTLASWAMLGTGIFLGGKWAYVELGWAGYWAWDPVENSSFMPWLCATASLHNILVLDKTGKLPRLTIFLGMLAFALTFLGTFITRSGVISSVHSFAESNIGPAYLTFVMVLLLASIALVTLRGQLLVKEEAEDGWRWSKETSLLFTNFFLLFLLALVLVGTLLPLVVEATRGIRISIQQPFFNAFAPWIGVGLVALVGVGNLMKWKTGRIEDPMVTLGFPALWSTALTLALALRKDLDVASTIGFWLVLWSMGVMIMDLVYRLRDLRWNASVMWRYNKPYLGSWVAHIGFLVAIAGFLGGYRGIEATTTLDKGESTTFYNYTLTNQGLRAREGSNYTFVSAVIEAKDSQGRTHIVEPTRSKFTNNEEWLNEIGVHSTFWHDLYLILGSFDYRQGEQVTLRMNINPTVKLVWASIVIMSLGATLGLSHRMRRRTLDINSSGAQPDDTDENPTQRILGDVTKGQSLGSALIIALAFLICTLGMSSVALAQEAPASLQTQATPAPPVIRLDPELISIGRELRCPTCQGLSIVDSQSTQSEAMKKEIESLLAQGRSRAEILDHFKQRYGEWILREPDAASGMGLVIWLIPLIGLALGPVVLVGTLRYRRKQDALERQRLRAEILAFLDQEKKRGPAPAPGASSEGSPT